MDKSTDQAKTEQKLYKFWEDSGFFKADPNSAKKPYSLLMPPPNLTGDLHLGHAMQHSIMDAIARFKRMQGYDVLLLPGVDHAGIQFEGTLNKQLEKEGLSKQKLGREQWLKRAWQFKDEVYQSFHQTWTVFGLCADWSREVFTLDEGPRQAVFEQFKTYYDRGLIYKGAYIVQWCPKCNTAIEETEMEYQERQEKLYLVRYSVILGNQVTPESVSGPAKTTDTNQYLTIATARPETIYADTGIAVYPNHPKFSKFVGQTALHPLTRSNIPIFEDERVDKDFGTGALKITPGHDPLDFEIGQDHKLPILHAVGKDGRMTELAGDLAGLKVSEARQKAADKLRQLNTIEKEEDYIHAVPVCERCKTTVEPLISEEWFVKIEPLAREAIKTIKDKKINFLPKNYAKILTDWLENIHDWCISRSLWWGHRIPVWYKGTEIKVSLETPGEGWTQDEKVLDTWFSSGLWPLSTLGWPKQTKGLVRYFPWDFEISAPEIKYLWIARMIMISLYFQGEIPFENMFFHGMLRDLQGRKFSKSLGNGINPNQLRAQWGTDATRMALYSYSAPGRDGKTSRQLMDERCKNYRNFATKLRNIAHFIIDLNPNSGPETSTLIHPEQHSSHPEAPSEGSISTHPDDEAIIEKLNQTIINVTKDLESFNLHLATEKLYDFIWHEFADKYIEASKSRRAEAQPTLEYVFKTSLELLHPFMPFLTEELWQRLPHDGDSIMLAKWPTP